MWPGDMAPGRRRQYRLRLAASPKRPHSSRRPSIWPGPIGCARWENDHDIFLVREPPRGSLRLPGCTIIDRGHRQPRRDDMKLAVTMAMALVTLAAVDSASARPRQQASIGKSVAGKSLAPTGLKASQSGKAVPGATTQGIIMSDGMVCDPIRHMGC